MVDESMIGPDAEEEGAESFLLRVKRQNLSENKNVKISKLL